MESTIISQTQSERVDDLPLIIYWLKQMNLDTIIDEKLPPPHGNRKGLTYGQLTILLLTYILSEADHRLCCVEQWVNQHHRSLQSITQWNISHKDATDDRCGDLLATLGNTQEHIAQMEMSLGQHLIRAYQLPTDKARSDTTSFSVHHQYYEDNDKSSLLKFGYSKDKRPDLQQYRQMLATLDPNGIPLVGITLAGNGTDERDYLPTWRQMKKIIGHSDFLFLADSKASSWYNRAQIDELGGIYCFPLAMSKPRPKLLSDWISNPPDEIIKIRQQGKKESEEQEIGEGFEIPLGSIWRQTKTHKCYRWLERWLVIKSNKLAHRQIKSLHSRLEKVEGKLAKLTQRPGNDENLLRQKIEEIIKKYGMSKYIQYSINKKISYEKVYRGQGSRTDSSSYKRVRKTKLIFSYETIQEQIDSFEEMAGWRLYVTNAKKDRLSLTQAVESYKEQWQPEQGFHRFKKGRLSALPIYFRDENKIKGLMFLLTIGLRVLTLMEFVVRSELKKSKLSLDGLYEGNRKRKTNRPTAEKLLKVFCNMTLYIHRDGTREISLMNEIQKKILKLMKIPKSIYLDLSVAPS